MWEVVIDPELQEWAQKLVDGAIMRDAINAGLNELYPAVYTATSAHTEHGTMLKALTPITYATGPTAGGIGDMEMVGDPFKKAPPHTISEFVRWWHETHK